MITCEIRVIIVIIDVIICKIYVTKCALLFRVTISQGGRGHFTYLLEGQIHFALKLSATCLI